MEKMNIMIKGYINETVPVYNVCVLCKKKNSLVGNKKNKDLKWFWVIIVVRHGSDVNVNARIRSLHVPDPRHRQILFQGAFKFTVRYAPNSK